MEEDISLIERYLEGDEGAIEGLVMRYQRQVYSFIYRMIDDMEEAKDITQKTFIKAIKGIKGFRKEVNMDKHIFNISIFTFLNVLHNSKWYRSDC